MYSELDSICRFYGIIYQPDKGVEQDVQFGDFTHGCYKAFMDREISSKFGSGFIEKILNEADSIYIAKSSKDTVPNYFCDKRPEACSKNFTKDFFSNFHYPKSCNLNSLCFGCEECTDCNFRVLFLVDTNGFATEYKFYGSHSRFKNESINEIKEHIINCLENFNCWTPGILGNHKVLTYGDLLIDFSRRNIQ
jgi:hypothetical protein